jgi:hypothetical protein
MEPQKNGNRKQDKRQGFHRFAHSRYLIRNVSSWKDRVCKKMPSMYIIHVQSVKVLSQLISISLWQL